MRRLRHAFAAACLVPPLLAGCYDLRSSDGGGQTDFDGTRTVRAEDIAVPDGYRVEAVATGLTFPTGVAVDDAGVPHVVEAGYSYGEVFTVPRLLRIEADGSLTEVARGERNGPWTGVAFAQGAFFVAEGGQLEGGRILRITPDGAITALVSGLPGNGDHHTNGPAVGADGMIYFGQGTATNSGVVGVDNAQFGWLERFPDFHDVPCADVTLAGLNFESPNPLKSPEQSPLATGAFSPFGTATRAGQVIRGALPCSGAVMRVAPEGGALELVAWGFRNPFGLAFAPGGELFVTDNGYDNRGSRPVWGAPDVLWRVESGRWYGWPDYSAAIPLSDARFKPAGRAQPAPLLAEPPGTPPDPVAVLGVHASANGIAFSTSPAFGHVGEAFIAEFGDQAPTTGKVLHPVGFRVVRVDVASGRVENFAVNPGEHLGPASKIGSGGLERPVGVAFSPDGTALYVVDFGVMLQDTAGSHPQQATGVLWRITPE